MYRYISALISTTTYRYITLQFCSHYQVQYQPATADCSTYSTGTSRQLKLGGDTSFYDCLHWRLSHHRSIDTQSTGTRRFSARVERRLRAVMATAALRQQIDDAGDVRAELEQQLTALRLKEQVCCSSSIVGTLFPS